MKSYLSYGERLEILRRKKIVQTREKIEKEGGLDEDDYLIEFIDEQKATDEEWFGEDDEEGDI